MRSALHLEQLSECPPLDPQIEVLVKAIKKPKPRTWHTDTHDGTTRMRVSDAGGLLWMSFPGAATFVVERSGDIDSITVEIAPGSDPRTIEQLLVDDVLPYVIAHHGGVVLHAAGVVVSGVALLVAGRSGIGKSTLSSTFSHAGFALLSDDCVVAEQADGRFYAQPGIPSVRLWPRSAVAVLGSDDGGVALSELSDKRRYRGGLTFAHESAPITAIVEIAWPPAAFPDLVRIDDLAGHEAFALIHAHQYMPRTCREASLTSAIELARNVRVARIGVPNDLERLPDVMEALLAWVHKG